MYQKQQQQQSTNERSRLITNDRRQLSSHRSVFSFAATSNKVLRLLLL